MVGNVTTLKRDLFVRRCVACGYDGALLQSGRAPRCARCGCDLHHRPALSYAEMEGFIGQPVTLSSPLLDEPRESTSIQRWLAFLFVVMTSLLVLVYLVSAAIP